MLLLAKFAASVSVPTLSTALMLRGFVHVFPPELKVELLRPSYVHALVPEFVMPATNVTEPKKEATVDLVNAGVFVTPVQFMAGTLTMFCVIVRLPAVMELASKIAVSCKSGMAGEIGVAPPLVVIHGAVDQFDELPVTM